MPISFRTILPFAAVLLAGCVDVATPVSFQLELESGYVLNDDGTCTARVTAQAAGTGTASWQGVNVYRGEALRDEYGPGEVSTFWGSSTISAGEVQVSTPVVVPEAGLELEILYQVRNPGLVTVRMDCANAA